MPTPPSSSSAWQARQALGSRLGEIRDDAGLTGRALALLCGWHESKVSRIEHAKTAPSPDDIRAWCRHCGAQDQAADLIAALRAVEGMFIEWRRMERTGLRRAQEAVLPLWERTRLFRAYSSWLIPGAVQTTAYTRAVLQAIAKRRELPDDVDEAVAVRADRLRLLREGGRRFLVLVEEPVLRSVIGGPEVMAGQLGHLISVASLPSVSLGIIPMGIDRDSVWSAEGFWIFDEAQVNVELVSGWLTLTQPRDIAMYAKTFSDLADLAVRGKEARALITAAIDVLA
ncbi:MAG TPA: transcriptional regulator [Actinobacteria bacterium]|nr:transcriptional regulator [Actinomycetota bacterium]